MMLIREVDLSLIALEVDFGTTSVALLCAVAPEMLSLEAFFAWLIFLS